MEIKFRISWTDSAIRSIKKIKRAQFNDAKHIVEAVETLNRSPFSSGNRIKKLKGYKELYRLRYGDYRIVYQLTGKDVYIIDVLRKPDFEKKY